MQKSLFSVYIHWPYCSTMCSYCAFNKYLIPHGGMQHDLLEASMLKDLKYDLDRSHNHSILNSVYFGGGTPSLARPIMISKILNELKSFGLDGNTEVTLEINPTSKMTIDALASFKDAGINRLSIGFQSLRNETLNAFNRNHTVETAMQVLDSAKSLFDNISLDFIYSRNDQSPESWNQELKEILCLKVPHLTLYQLMIERGTSFFKKREALPNEDDACEMFDITIQMCADAGYHQYEVSSFAISDEFKSRHNLGYWRGVDYIGVGPGAHGRITLPSQIIKTFRILEPNQWMDFLECNPHGIKKEVNVDADSMLRESLVFGLRTIDGVSIMGKEFNSVLDMEKIRDLVQEGYLSLSDDSALLKPTPKGLKVMDSVLPLIMK